MREGIDPSRCSNLADQAPRPRERRWEAARSTYSRAPLSMSVACSSLRSPARLAGMPTMRLRDGNTRPSGTTAPAATIEPSPIFAPFRIVAPMPTRQLFPISHPCTTALWPTTQPSPTIAGYPGSACKTHPSWMLVLAPMRMGSVSPRSTAPYHTLDSPPRCTSPMTKAPGATQADRTICGEASPCGSRFPGGGVMTPGSSPPLPSTSPAPFASNVWTGSDEPALEPSSHLDQHGVALAAAGADGREAFTPAPAPQLVEERRQDAGAGGADGVAE